MGPLSEAAAAPLATPHWPVTVMVRVPLPGIEGGPYSPPKPLPERVSAIRHGVTATNGRGEVTIIMSNGRNTSRVLPRVAVVPARRFCGGLQNAGAGQLNTSDPTARSCAYNTADTSA